MVGGKSPVSTRFPAGITKALMKAVEKGLALNEADYIRDAVRKKLREDGLL